MPRAARRPPPKREQIHPAVFHQSFAGDEFAEPASISRRGRPETAIGHVITFSNAPRTDRSADAPRAIASTVDAGCWARKRTVAAAGSPSALTPDRPSRRRRCRSARSITPHCKQDAPADRVAGREQLPRQRLGQHHNRFRAGAIAATTARPASRRMPRFPGISGRPGSCARRRTSSSFSRATRVTRSLKSSGTPSPTLTETNPAPGLERFSWTLMTNRCRSFH